MVADENEEKEELRITLPLCERVRVKYNFLQSQVVMPRKMSRQIREFFSERPVLVVLIPSTSELGETREGAIADYPSLVY